MIQNNDFSQAASVKDRERAGEIECRELMTLIENQDKEIFDMREKLANFMTKGGRVPREPEQQKEILEKMTKGREERRRKLTLIKAGRARRMSANVQPKIKEPSGQSLSEESQKHASDAELFEYKSNPKVSIVVNDLK